MKRPLPSLILCCILAAALGGCAVVAVGSAAVGVVGTAAGLAVDTVALGVKAGSTVVGAVTGGSSDKP